MDIRTVDARVPLPLDQVIGRLGLAAGETTPLDVMRQVAVNAAVLEDFRPLAESLEWRLGAAHWKSTGVLPFADQDVPYIINNTGRLSTHAAVLLFEHLEGARSEAPCAVLELGAGTGLFARYFLDAFVAICEQQGRDHHRRLRYFVSDYSETTVRQWRERGLFAGHEGRAVPGRCDAQHPAAFTPADPSDPGLPAGAVDAVFCNYVLDVLPAAMIRRDGEQVLELNVRTRLAEAAGADGLTADGVRALIGAETPEAQARLTALMGAFEFETAFLPASPAVAANAAGLDGFAPEVETLSFNYGALAALRRMDDILRPDGFVLVNDYGTTDVAQAGRQSIAQRFGATSAVGLNFPLLAHVLGRDGWTVVAPEGDEEASVHARLLSRRPAPRTVASFENRFSAAAQAHLEGPLDEARAAARAGRQDAALQGYRLAVERSPRDWVVLGEAAEFVGLQLGDYESGLMLARAAVELNPWYSPWLWNVLGDCLYCRNLFPEAHEAYLQAARINPQDVRTNLDLAHTWAQQGDTDRALEAVARGLARDHAGLYRDRLLERQQHILHQIQARRLAAEEALVRRAARLGPDAPVAIEAKAPPPPT